MFIPEGSSALTHASPVIGPYTVDEFIAAAARFHGYAAPGLILGGFMVHEAKSHIPEGVLFDAISETAWCLPDAVQMLTPCTVGNGWLRIFNLGLYAVSLFNKHTGKGVRVAVETDLLEPYPTIREWLFKLKPKKEQDSDRLREEIRTAGASANGSGPGSKPWRRWPWTRPATSSPKGCRVSKKSGVRPSGVLT